MGVPETTVFSGIFTDPVVAVGHVVAVVTDPVPSLRPLVHLIVYVVSWSAATMSWCQTLALVMFVPLVFAKRTFITRVFPEAVVGMYAGVLVTVSVWPAVPTAEGFTGLSSRRLVTARG